MSDTEELKPATVLREVQAFIGIMFGRGPDAIIPETMATPVGPSVNLGDIMRGVAAVIEREERVPPGVETEGGCPSLTEAAEMFADAADFNLTCWEAQGDGPTPANVTRLYELGQEAKRLLSTSSRGEDDLSSLAMTPASLPASDGRPETDAAYEERNRLVALLASMFPSGIARTDIPGWLPEWHGCVYIDMPCGQASWHYHDSQAHLFAHLPPYTKPWDGHTTEQKYDRIAALTIGGIPTPSPAVMRDYIDRLTRFFMNNPAWVSLADEARGYIGALAPVGSQPSAATGGSMNTSSSNPLPQDAGRELVEAKTSPLLYEVINRHRPAPNKGEG